MAKVTTYVSLRSAVRKMLRQGEEAGAAKRVTRYYGIGEMIDTHVLGHVDRAEYCKEVIQRLYEMLNVRRAYRISRPAGKFGWAHPLKCGARKAALRYASASGLGYSG